jgi:hypothetical protein
MFFFIKKSEIVIDCFTDSKIVHDAFPIDCASNFYPSWWKKIESTTQRFNGSKVETGSTIKSCAGLIDYYKSGLVIPMWCDFSIKIEQGKADWEFANNKFSAEHHNRREWESFDPDAKMSHIKFHSPWRFKTKDNVKWIYKNSYWNDHPFKWYSLPEAIVEYKYQHTTNVNLFINNQDLGHHSIECGFPLVHLIPLTEKKLIIKNHLISKDDFDQQFEPGIVAFRHSYRKYVNAVKKCPFHNK